MPLEDRQLKESAIWKHLTSVVSSVVAERPADAVDVLESVSQFTQTGKRVPPAANSKYQAARVNRDKTLVTPDVLQDTQWAKNFCTQLVPPKPARKVGEEEEEAEPEVEEDKGELPDVVTEQSVFNRFGEGLSEPEAFRLVVSLKRLLDKEPLAKVRFWGKIFGQLRDYYVCEAKIDESRVPEKEAADEEAAEQVGKAPDTIYLALNIYRAKEAPRVAAETEKGVNEFTYYVATSDDLSKWVQLADVLPSHIVAARAITKFFTGDLDAPVECHPPFPGLERHYLRAQIARIAHGTLVCPKDMFTTDAAEEEEEDEDGKPKPKRYEVKPFEEIPAMNPQEAPDAEDAEAVAPLKMWFHGFAHDELLEAKNWVHVVPQLLQEGRVTKFKSEEEPEADEEEDTDAPPSTEWIHPFLADLGHDQPLSLESHSKASFVPWAVRRAYHNESDACRSYLIRSSLWPGSMCFAECEDNKPGAKFQNVYIGRGVKSLVGAVYAPPLPPTGPVEFPFLARLQKDSTRDDELEFEPAPAAPKLPGEGEGENAEEEE